MNMRETRLSAEPDTKAGGCCGSHSQHSHADVSVDQKPVAEHAVCGTSKAADAVQPTEKAKPSHGSGCCCS